MMEPHRLYCDTRYGGKPRWSLGPPKDAKMRIPDDLLACPVFIGGRDRSGNPRYRGTGFLVALWTSPAKRAFYTVLVTARHNVLRALEEYAGVCVRINTADGSATDIDINRSWIYPEDDDSASDIAIVPFDLHSYDAPDPDVVLPLPEELFASEELATKHGLGVGDELIVVGLFSRHVGTQRNLPIVRAGTIASMPHEPMIDPNSGLPYDAYLAEVRSIGGLSGSPVFVRLGVGGWSGKEGITPPPRILYLLGLVRGHWNHPRGDAEAELDELNTGIATVTPIGELLPLLEREEMVQYKKAIDRRAAERDAPVDDFATEDDTSEFERFEDLTRKLVNVPKREIDQRRSDEP